MLEPHGEPLPSLREEVHEVAEILLTGRRIHDGAQRNAKEGQREEKDEDPEHGFEGRKHGRGIIQQESPSGTISA